MKRQILLFLQAILTLRCPLAWALTILKPLPWVFTILTPLDQVFNIQTLLSPLGLLALVVPIQTPISLAEHTNQTSLSLVGPLALFLTIQTPVVFLTPVLSTQTPLFLGSTIPSLLLTLLPANQQLPLPVQLPQMHLRHRVCDSSPPSHDNHHTNQFTSSTATRRSPDSHSDSRIRRIIALHSARLFARTTRGIQYAIA